LSSRKAQPPSRPDLSATVKLLNRLGEFFNRSTSILIAEARIALEPSKRISRVRNSGWTIETFPERYRRSIKLHRLLFTLLFTLATFFERISDNVRLALRGSFTFGGADKSA